MESPNLIVGTSKAAELIRTMDWSGTPLGAIESWPEAFVASVNTVLNAPLPMQLFWGPEFLCIYNDAMTPALSTKHPNSMGAPAYHVWREAWDTIGPQMERVLATADSVYHSESLVPLLSDGVLRDQYWTYSYSPIFGPHNQVVGVLDIAQDVTSVVLAKHADAARRESEERLWAFTHATNNALYQMSADWSVMYQLDGKSFLVDTAKRRYRLVDEVHSPT